MTDAEFNRLLENRIHKIKTVLAKKSKEYSSNSDRLHSFKLAARLHTSTPQKSLLGMLMKHLVSVIGLVDKESPTAALVDEKIGDTINYLILLEAIFQEKRDSITC